MTQKYGVFKVPEGAIRRIKDGRGHMVLRVTWVINYRYGNEFIWPFLSNEAIADLQKEGFDIGPADWDDWGYLEHEECEGVRLRPGIYRMQKNERKEVVGA